MINLDREGWLILFFTLFYGAIVFLFFAVAYKKFKESVKYQKKQALKKRFVLFKGEKNDSYD